MQVNDSLTSEDAGPRSSKNCTEPGEMVATLGPLYRGWAAGGGHSPGGAGSVASSEDVRRRCLRNAKARSQGDNLGVFLPLCLFPWAVGEKVSQSPGLKYGCWCHPEGH